MAEVLFVTGGARSGKSRFAASLAAQLAAERGAGVVYLATMEPLDDELLARVARHHEERPAGWRTIEAPRDLLGALAEAGPGAVVLLDCLSLWVTNRLLVLGDAPTPEATAALERLLLADLDAVLGVAAARRAELIVVTNEVGGGVVPDTPLGRVFRDLLGVANQRVAAYAGRAWLLVAGRALPLPGTNPGSSES